MHDKAFVMYQGISSNDSNSVEESHLKCYEIENLPTGGPPHKKSLMGSFENFLKS